MTIYNWQRFAACRGLPTEWFFAHERDQTVPIPPAALRACRNCPVRTSCLDHALHHEMYGVWSGTTRGQRVRLRRQLGIVIQQPREMNVYHDGDQLFPS